MEVKKYRFGKIVKRLREGKNLSMSELAKQLGTTKSSINMWENADVIPREAMLIKVADYFNVSLDYLFGLDYKDLQLQRIQQLQKKTNFRAEKLKRAIDRLNEEDLTKLIKMFIALYGEKYEYILETEEENKKRLLEQFKNQQEDN